MRIIYPVSERIDFSRARFHQILQTVHALVQIGCVIDLLTGESRNHVEKDILPYYGLAPHKNLQIYHVPILETRRNWLIHLSWDRVFYTGALLKIRNLQRQGGYTAIYLRHLGLADFLLRWRNWFKMPIVFEAHEVFHLTTDRPGKARQIKEQEKRVYKHLDGVIAISEGLAEHLQELFSIHVPMEVIPDGVNLDFFRIKRDIFEKGKIICVSHLYPWKGVDILIQAMSYLPEWRLHLVGGGKKEIEELKKMAKKLGVNDQIVFHGQVSLYQVREQLANAQVAVLPFTKKNIAARYSSPLKLFEYMAAALPIVASDLPSIREILQDGVNAILVEPENPQALAEGIRRISSAEIMMKLSHKAAEDAQKFTWKMRAERIFRFLEKIKTRK